MRRMLLGTMTMVALAFVSATMFAVDPAPAAPAKLDFGPSSVTISVKDAKVADVLKMLAEKSGNAPLALPDKWQEKTVTLDVKDMPYFAALDYLCALTGLTYVVKDQSVVLESAPEAKDVGVYLGPATVKAAQLTKYRAFRDSNNGQAVSLQLSLCAFWEDRLPVVFDACDVTKVSTADGRTLELRTRRGRPTSHFIGRNNYFTTLGNGPAPAARSGFSASPIFAQLLNLPEKMGRTVTVEGTFRLSLGAGEKVLTVPKVLMEGDRSATADEISFTVKKVQTMTPGAGGVVYGPWDGRAKNPVSFEIEVRKDAQEPIVMPGGSSPYSIFVADPDGKRYPSSIVSGSQQQSKDGAWVATVYAFFDKPAAMDDTWSLIYVYPDKQATKEWPFKIENVPLP